MRETFGFLLTTFVAGLLILVPVYISILLLLQAAKSVAGLARPLAMLFPESFPAEHVLSVLVVVMLCFLVGLVVRHRIGRAAQQRIETSLFERLPGYAVVRSLTQRLAGYEHETAWKPALVEIEDALVPGFIVEVLDDGRLSVFVPSVPTPFAGAVYILSPDRVHPLDLPFTQAIKTVSRWGSGANELVAAMKVPTPPSRMAS